MHHVWNRHDHGNSQRNLKYGSCCSCCTGNATVLTHPSSIMKSQIHCLAVLRRKLLHNLLSQLDNSFFPKQAKHANSPDIFDEFLITVGETTGQMHISVTEDLWCLPAEDVVFLVCGWHLSTVYIRGQISHNKVRLWPVLMLEVLKKLTHTSLSALHMGCKMKPMRCPSISSSITSVVKAVLSACDDAPLDLLS